MDNLRAHPSLVELPTVSSESNEKLVVSSDSTSFCWRRKLCKMKQAVMVVTELDRSCLRIPEIDSMCYTTERPENNFKINRLERRTPKSIQCVTQQGDQKTRNFNVIITRKTPKSAF